MLNLYADDTSIFLKATEENLRNSFKTLQWFYQLSGLKINISKTKVIRIGPIRETDCCFCRENNLEWVHKFNALGINYDTLDIENITDLNINEKLESMNKLMQLWICRNITPSGRVTVFKSLILSKITHILQSLPSPSTQTLKKLEKSANNFIWRNKRHEVNKNTLLLPLENGGQNMININEFDKALKITWLRKLNTQNPDWEEFPLATKIDRLIWTGENYHEKILANTKNPFWKSVIKAFQMWYKSIKNTIIIPPRFQPIWGNNILRIPFNNKMYKNNFLFLPDLFNQNGEFLSRAAIEQRIECPLMFTSYYALFNAIPREWKEEIQNTILDYNLTLPPIMALLTKSQKGTREIRQIWSKQRINYIPPAQLKWSEELNLNPEITDWKYIYSIAQKCKLDARTTYFHFQVAHRTVITNKKLKLFNLRENDQCEFCQTIETISHMLYDYPTRALIWQHLGLWLSQFINSNIYLDKNSILLGNSKNEPITNAIILITKHEIFKNKCKGNLLDINQLIFILKHHMQVELYIGTIKNQLPKVLGKWAALYQTLHDL